MKCIVVFKRRGTYTHHVAYDNARNAYTSCVLSVGHGAEVHEACEPRRMVVIFSNGDFHDTGAPAPEWAVPGVAFEYEDPHGRVQRVSILRTVVKGDTVEVYCTADSLPQKPHLKLAGA